MCGRFTIWISSSAQDIPVKILKINRRRGNVVVSRKMAVEEELKARKHAALEHLAEGSVVSGVVKNLTEYGAFVDLGGIDGLLHVSDMSHGRVNHPSEVVHVGEEITRESAEVRHGKGTNFAGNAAVVAGSMGDFAGALSRRAAE